MLTTSNPGFLGTWAAGFLELRAIQFMFLEFKFILKTKLDNFGKMIICGHFARGFPGLIISRFLIREHPGAQNRTFQASGGDPGLGVPSWKIFRRF